MLRIRTLFLGACLALAACTSTEAPPPAPPPPPPNPFAQPSALPFEAPDFARIKDGDYQPAIEEGMRIQIAEIERIAGDPAPATFENTIAAMETSGQMLRRVQRVFTAVSQANTNDTLQKVKAAVAPQLAAHLDAIYLNPKLFARIEALYGERDRLGLGQEQRMLVEVYYKKFVSSGARLSDADKESLRDINKQLSTLQTQYEEKLLAGTKDGALVVDDKSKLAGLSDAQIAAAAKAAEDRGLAGKWVIPLQNTTQQPSLLALENREVREALFHNGWIRTEKGDANDTRETIAAMDQLRIRKATLLGYPNYAAYVLEDQMAKTPAAVEEFLGKLVPAATAKARAEAKDIRAMIRKGGGRFALEPWDWNRYAEEVRKARFNLDENQVKPYFELNNVLRNGILYAANQLYGISFKERKDIPVYHPDVRVFEVFDADGSEIGLMYFDYFKRDNKAGGAWKNNLVDQSKVLGTKPVVTNVCNFPKPAPGEPALLTDDEVTTAFHEFGHALHGLFANQLYPTLSGSSTARDFVEFPSQFNEHWALEPAVLKHYAVHFKTGEPIPEALVARIKKAGTFNQGYAMTEILAAAQLDMQWHLRAAGSPKVADVDAFEADALKKTKLSLREVPPRYRSSYFTHIWSHNYAAGYYAYSWAEMLDHDAFEWFKRNGGMTRQNGQRFRDMILSRGRTIEYGEMYRAFTDKDPEIGPMLEFRGLAKVRKAKGKAIN